MMKKVKSKVNTDRLWAYNR